MNIIYNHNNLLYPSAEKSFSPSLNYPEYPFSKDTISDEKNFVYEGIRTIFCDLELDKENQGSALWNPLGKYIKPGDTVLLKPNFVLDYNLSGDREDLDCLVTHPSIIRCIMDYVIIALKGEGAIYVADSPVKDCDFPRLMKKHNYRKIFSFMEKNGAVPMPILKDLRGPEEESQYHDIKEKGILVNLGKESYFYQYPGESIKYRVPNYDFRKVQSHHLGEVQEYSINEIALTADVIINLPKPKTHRKSGYTGAMKNFVGINYSKEYLPHHTYGSLEKGGDEFSKETFVKYISSIIRQKIDIKRTQGKNSQILWSLYRCLKKLDNLINDDRVLEGAWFNNNTLWKTVLDLNHVVQYADKNGIIQKERQRTILTLGDMVISGEKEGPLAPSPKELNTLLFSDNVVEFDCVLAAIMGFDYEKLKVLSFALNDKRLFEKNYNEIEVMINSRPPKLLTETKFKNTPFEAAKEWKGHIELRN